MEIKTVLGDISEVKGFDAIVNTTNNRLSPGIRFGHVDGAIHRKAGKKLDEECNAIGECKTGEAVITDAYELDCKRIIHTVGPVWQGDGTEEVLLESCYYSIMNLARKEGLRKLAIPAISVGAHRYPEEESAQVAVETVSQFCNNYPEAFDEIVFVLYNEGLKAIYDKIIARKRIRELGYLSLSLDVVSYDSSRLHDIIVELAEEKLSAKQELLKKLLIAVIDSVPEQMPEKLLVSVTRFKQLKKLLFSPLNNYLDTEGYRFKIRDIMLKSRKENGSLQLIFEIEDYNFTEFIDNICRKVSVENENKYMRFILSGVKIVNETIAEENKEELLKNLINGLQKEIGAFIEEFLEEQYKLFVRIGTMELLN